MQLSDVIGRREGDVDWRRSFFLNLICHTVFTLSLVVCEQGEVQHYRKGQSEVVNPITKVGGMG